MSIVDEIHTVIYRHYLACLFEIEWKLIDKLISIFGKGEIHVALPVINHRP